MVSTQVAIRIARHAGLSESDARVMLNMLLSIQGIYRLPREAMSAPSVKERGVGQGLSTSVLLAELYLALLAWKINLTTTAVTITYVDDVHI